jgi:hypothetical protein
MRSISQLQTRALKIFISRYLEYLGEISQNIREKNKKWGRDLFFGSVTDISA